MYNGYNQIVPRLGVLDGGDFQGAVMAGAALLMLFPAGGGHRFHLDLCDPPRPAARPPAAVALDVVFVIVWQWTSGLLLNKS